MGKKDKSFNIGDLVFAKVKGYPPWPAKITKTNNKKYSVYFYGTGETANIKIEDLFNYKDSKNKFATDKNLKRAHFREAIAQIEAALEGEDSAPINLEEFDASVVAQSDAGGNDTTIATDLDETNLLDDTVAEEADEVSSAATTAPQAAAAEETVDEVATEVVEEPRAVVDVKPPVEEIVSSSTSPAAEATAAGAKGANETEIVSRSGRKIKPKRYMDEEEVPQNPSKRIKAETTEKRLMDPKNPIQSTSQTEDINIQNDEDDDTQSTRIQNEDNIIESKVVAVYDAEECSSVTTTPIAIENDVINVEDDDLLCITDIETIPIVNIDEREPPRTPSRKSTLRQSRRKKPSQDNAYIAIMREKTKVLKELASTSTVLNEILESPEKTITQQYFDVYSAEIELLPSDLQLRCQREVHQSVTDIIHKYQDLAEAMKKTRSCRILL
ncbi:PC4 and SFRS1-interacting protein isoform X2 [Episyrphus balteatus]|uniref:PC4 and SFRS1-interacting protein isoform X2 n=1 Tax=Episyrphus balteatus TaxID=286459 RepID=UPI002485B8F0|nr:PC4 and SFRS1-interacting protein isoform X2 [Episyrphus balteatus]